MNIIMYVIYDDDDKPVGATMNEQAAFDFAKSKNDMHHDYHYERIDMDSAEMYIYEI